MASVAWSGLIKGGTAGGGAVPEAAEALRACAESGRGGKSGLRAQDHVAQGSQRRGLAEAGIPEGFVRLSCGIEDAEDLIADLEQALAR